MLEEFEVLKRCPTLQSCKRKPLMFSDVVRRIPNIATFFSHTKYKMIKDRVIYTFTQCQQNWSHIAAHVIQALLYSRQLTRDVWRHNVPNYRKTSVFYVCDFGLHNSDKKFQTPIALLFVNNNIKCGCAFSQNKRNILVPNLFDFAD